MFRINAILVFVLSTMYLVCLAHPEIPNRTLIINALDTIFWEEEVNKTDSLQLVDISQQSATCNNLSNGGLSFTVRGGTPPFQYSLIYLPSHEAVNRPLEISSDGRSVAITDLITGLFQVKVQDSGNPSLMVIDTIKVLVEFTIGLNIENIIPLSCFGGNDGSLAAVVTKNGIRQNDLTGYNFNWNLTEESVPTLTNLSYGFYSVAVTDEYGCYAEASITLAQPPALIVPPENTIIEDVYCSSPSSGRIAITPIGGSSGDGNYTFIWNNGNTVNASFSQLTGLEPGPYYVTILDDNECMLVDTFVVNGETTLTTAIDDSGNLLVTGGVPPYTYFWSNGSANQIPLGVEPGVHSITITDANGCIVSTEVLFGNTGEKPFPVISIAQNNPDDFAEKVFSQKLLQTLLMWEINPNSELFDLTYALNEILVEKEDTIFLKPILLENDTVYIKRAISELEEKRTGQLRKDFRNATSRLERSMKRLKNATISKEDSVISNKIINTFSEIQGFVDTFSHYHLSDLNLDYLNYQVDGLAIYVDELNNRIYSGNVKDSAFLQNLYFIVDGFNDFKKTTTGSTFNSFYGSGNFINFNFLSFLTFRRLIKILGFRKNPYEPKYLLLVDSYLDNDQKVNNFEVYYAGEAYIDEKYKLKHKLFHDPTSPSYKFIPGYKFAVWLAKDEQRISKLKIITRDDFINELIYFKNDKYYKYNLRKSISKRQDIDLEELRSKIRTVIEKYEGFYSYSLKFQVSGH